MPRRHPARPRRTPPPVAPPSDLLPSRVARALDRLEDHRVSPAAVTWALRDWRRFAELSPRALRQPYDDRVDFIGPFAREDIENAVRRLPPRPARELAALVEPWDELYRSKSSPDPFSDRSREWWFRRRND